VTAQPSDDADLEDVKLRPAARLASGAHGASGAVCAMAALQFIGLGRFEVWEIALQIALAALGVVQVVLGVMVLRNHYGGAVAGAIVGPIVAALAGAYLVVSMSWGVATCLAFVAPPIAGTAALLGFFAIAPTRRAMLAKRRLAEAGVELGL
jgi:hypothetical protein